MESEGCFIDPYYEQSGFWGKSPKPEDAERIKLIKDMIPSGVASVLDAGCGDGILANSLSIKKVVGIELSREAIKYVKSEKVRGDLSFIPFLDKTFDMVVCSEVLEHLPQETYKKTLKEIQRVATKYIIISVPNNEPLQQAFVQCDDCRCIFNAYRHMRVFNTETMQNLFNEHHLIKYILCGPVYKNPNLFLLKIRKYLLEEWPNLQNALCPQCGSKNICQSQRNLFVSAAKLFNRIIPKKKRKRWLIALYENIQVQD